jgi:hypothetical protein
MAASRPSTENFRLFRQASFTTVYQIRFESSNICHGIVPRRRFKKNKVNFKLLRTRQGSASRRGFRAGMVAPQATHLVRMDKPAEAERQIRSFLDGLD